MNLAECHEGAGVLVTSVGASGAIRQRLLDMGIVKGAEVSVERYAPLRDPLHIKIKGYSLALRVAEAKVIQVKEIEKI
jgi:ferrous iron transport protein B